MYCSDALQQGACCHSEFTLVFVLRVHCPQASHNPRLIMGRTLMWSYSNKLWESTIG